jgi:hypothetical protein
VRERLAAAFEHRLHLAYTRLFVTPKSHRAYGLPPAGPWVLVPLATAPLVAATELARRVVPGIEQLVDRAARRRRSRWFARQMGGRAPEYKPVEQFTR